MHIQILWSLQQPFMDWNIKFKFEEHLHQQNLHGDLLKKDVRRFINFENYCWLMLFGDTQKPSLAYIYLSTLPFQAIAIKISFYIWNKRIQLYYCEGLKYIQNIIKIYRERGSSTTDVEDKKKWKERFLRNPPWSLNQILWLFSGERSKKKEVDL